MKEYWKEFITCSAIALFILLMVSFAIISEKNTPKNTDISFIIKK